MGLKAKIEKLMDSRGITQSQIAKDIGADPRHIGVAIKRNSKKSDLVPLMAKHYKIPQEWFYSPDNDPIPTSDSSTYGANHGGGGNFELTPIADGPQLKRRIMDLDRELADIVSLWTQIPKKARGRYIRAIVDEGIQKEWFDEIPDALLAKLSAHEEIARLKKKLPPGTQ